MKNIFKIEELEPRLELAEWGDDKQDDKNHSCCGDGNNNESCLGEPCPEQ
jgi:hypothetical protein